MLYARARDVARSPEARELLAHVQQSRTRPEKARATATPSGADSKGSNGRQYMTDSAGNYTTASTTRPAAAAKTRPSSARILLLDAEGHDRELSQDEFDHESLSDQRLVWVDMPSGSKDRDMARDRAFLEHLGAPEDALDALLEVVGRPRLFEYGDVMRLEVTGLTQPVNESIEESQPVAVLCVVGPNWLVTVHDAPVAFLEEFRERVEGDSDLGDLDAVAFLATLLDWQLTSYDEEIRRIIATLDELEDQALRDSASQQETLEQLVSLRRRISRLRALLAPHEPVFAQLARPEFDRLSTSDSAEAFRTARRSRSRLRRDRRKRPRDAPRHV